jgi:cobalamin biosynthesis protein CobT
MEPPAPPPHSDADPNYKVFTTDFDEEIGAEDLADPPNWNACAPIWTSSWNP